MTPSPIQFPVLIYCVSYCLSLSITHINHVCPKQLDSANHFSKKGEQLGMLGQHPVCYSLRHSLIRRGLLKNQHATTVYLQKRIRSRQSYIYVYIKKKKKRLLPLYDAAIFWHNRLSSRWAQWSGRSQNSLRLRPRCMLKAQGILQDILL